MKKAALERPLGKYFWRAAWAEGTQSKRPFLTDFCFGLARLI